jgi:hypothetical protein
MARKVSANEFIRLFDHLKERTGGKPRNRRRALDEDPELAASLVKLHEICQWFDNHRKFSNSRIFTNSPPELPEALLEFEKNWDSDFIYTYSKDLLDIRDFLYHFRILVEQTKNRPEETAITVKKRPDLEVSIRRLHEIQQIVSARREVTSPFKTRPEFLEAFSDFANRWDEVITNLKVEWILDLGDGNVMNLEAPLLNDKKRTDADKLSHFDPDQDSLSDIFDAMSEHFSKGGSSYEEEWADALKWLQETVGLDLPELQSRWRDFPTIFVPPHLPDKRDHEQRYGLFGHLEQIRRAYIVGADLAAVALCRALTEALLKLNYLNVPDRENGNRGLESLIKEAQKRDDFHFLQKFNLLEKKDEADAILHIGKRQKTVVPALSLHPNVARTLVRNWLAVLGQMIVHAPIARSENGKLDREK